MLLIRVLHSEILKLKRTLAFRMVFIAPLLVATLQFFVSSNQQRLNKNFKLWESLLESALSVWAIFMLPLLITLETALINGIEHNENQWKHIFALPVARYNVYTAKFLVAQTLALISTLALCIFLLLAGFTLVILHPELAKTSVLDYSWLLKHALMTWLAAWLIIAIHNWVSIRWPTFTLAIGVGVGGTFFALFAAGAKIGKFYPWLLPVNTLNMIVKERTEMALLLGILGGLIVAIIGGVEFVRRDLW